MQTKFNWNFGRSLKKHFSFKKNVRRRVKYTFLKGRFGGRKKW